MKGNEMAEFCEVIGPAHWAVYFINGDATIFETDEEQAQADAWLTREGVRVIGVKDDEEPWFTGAFDLYAPECSTPEQRVTGGDVVTYVCEAL